MILTIVNVLYVLIAVAMIVLILLQRGSGAAAGAGFGGGASATVFGARGASSFLSRTTAILAILFMLISLGMAMYASRMSVGTAVPEQDLGVMGQLGEPAPAGDAAVPALTPSTGEDVPAAPAVPASDAPAPAAAEQPADDVPAPVEGGDASGS